MANRKDSKGRVLKTGESQRKDGTYMYRYTDIRGDRKSIYAGDLKELRTKEKEAQRDLDDGIDYSAGNITGLELVEKYFEERNNIKETTKDMYRGILKSLERHNVFYKKIRDIKQLDAKIWVSDMFSNGNKSATVKSRLTFVKSAFQQACDDNVLRSNPFNLKPCDYMKNDRAIKEALTPEQQKSFLNFVLSDEYGMKHYDDYVILLGTGLRIGEYMGLTENDIDLANRIIHVDHQIARVSANSQVPAGARIEYKISSLKSKSGRRDLYISDDVYKSLVRKMHISNKRDKGVTLNGYTGFINISNSGTSVSRGHTISAALRVIEKKYNEQFPDSPLPNITPHILRHTFCTNMVMNGVGLKTLQYIMGHSDVRLSLSIYTHVNKEFAISDMKKSMESRSNQRSAV